MANITAGKTGSITAISDDGLTLTVSGTVEATDTDRVIMLTNSTSHPGRYRLITAVDVDASTYTISNPFGTSVFRNLPSTANNETNNATNELNAAVNDTYVISRTLTEEASVNADLELVSDTNNYFRTTGTVTWLANCLLYDEDCTLEIDWQDHFRYSSSNGSVKTAGLILGRQNFGPNDTDLETGGFPSNSCHFIETSSNFISGTFDDPIVFHMNGGYWRGTAGATSNGVFYRFNDGQDQSFRFWNVSISGKFGGRVAGDYSVFYGNSSNLNDSGFAILNPLRMAVFQDNSVKGGIQALYSFPHTAGSTTVLATEIDDIQTRIIRLNGNNTTNNNNSVSTIANWDFDAIDRATTAGADLIAVEGHGSRTTVHDWVKDYQITITAADGSEMDSLGELIMVDAEGTEIQDSDDSLGNFEAQRLLAYKNTVANSNTNITTLESGDTFTPYEWAVKYRGHQLVTGNTDLRAPFGPIEVSRPALVDNNVVDTVANIDAYTDLGTTDKLYDYADKYKYETMSMPTATTQLFNKSGSDVQATDSQFDITLDPSATELLSYATTPFEYVLEQDTSGAMDIGEFGLRGDSDVNTNAPITSFTQWSAWDEQWLFIEVNDTDEGKAFLGRSTVTATRDASNHATFTLSDKIVVNDGSVGVQIATVGTTAGAPAATVADWTFTNDLDTELKDITVKTPADGYTGGLTGFRNVSVDTEIQGNIDCTSILNTFSDGDTIISAGTISGTIALNSGTYTISGGDISGLTINRADGQTEDVTIVVTADVDGTDDATLGSNVVYQTSLAVTVIGADTDEGRLSFFDTDNNSSFHETLGGNIEDTELTSSDFTEIAPDNVVWVVYSGGTAKDHREQVNLAAGANTVTINLSSQAYPAGDENAADYNPTALVFDSDNTTLTIEMERTSESTLNFGDGTFNNWLHTYVRGSVEYNELVAAIGASTNATGDNAIDSIGSVSGAKVNGSYIRITPGDNQTYNVGYVEQTSDDDSDIEVSRTVVDTGDSSITYTFNVVIPTEPANFDLATTVSSVGSETREILDERYLTSETVGNLGLGVPAYDGENLVTTVTT